MSGRPPGSPARPILFVARAGLCNRLRALVGYRTLAAACHVPFRLCWPVDTACHAAYEELFENDLTLVTPEDVQRTRTRGDADVFNDYPWFRRVWHRQAPSLPWRVFRDASLIRLRSLRPVAELRERIESFADEHRIAEMLGVHVRWTDNVRGYDRWALMNRGFKRSRTSTLEGFEARIRAALDAGDVARVFLATDNVEVEARLRARFGERLVTRPKEFLEVPSEYDPKQPPRGSTIDNALVELFLLSRCRRLVGTYFSSFSKVAAVIGGQPFEQIEGTAACREEHVRHLCGRDS